MQELKGKGSCKGTSKASGKQSKGKGGKLPLSFVPTPSYDEQDASIEDRKEKVTNTKFLERTWGVVRNSLINQGVTQHNLAVLEYTYVHWFTELENVPMKVALEDVLTPLYEVERESLISDFDKNLTPQERERERESCRDPYSISAGYKDLYFKLWCDDCSAL